MIVSMNMTLRLPTENPREPPAKLIRLSPARVRRRGSSKVPCRFFDAYGGRAPSTSLPSTLLLPEELELTRKLCGLTP